MSLADLTDPGATGPVGPPANASEKTLLVLEAAVAHSRFAQVVEATGLAKATVHRILATLVSRGYLAVGPDASYVAGPQFLALAGHALQRLDISTLAQPFVDELVAAVDCTVHVGAVNGDEIIYLVRSDGNKPYQMPSRVGLSIPMHCSGIGKAVLSGYSDDGLDRFIGRAGLAPRTRYSITDPDALRAELARTRERGYAVDREENVAGVLCVAAPVRDHTATVRYGLSISTLRIEHTLDQVLDLAPQVVSVAARLSAALGART